MEQRFSRTYDTPEIEPQPEIMQVTVILRWSKDGKLQQLWQDLHSAKTEWRDVPIEKE